MKHLISYKLFDIDDYLIDFIQLGFKTDIKVGSSYIL
jgi:hypothetical protein